ncbi:MAG: hypothetical protein ACLQJ7_17725 [Syntrophobacteraceae bacterium]
MIERHTPHFANLYNPMISILASLCKAYLQAQVSSLSGRLLTHLQ